MSYTPGYKPSICTPHRMSPRTHAKAHLFHRSGTHHSKSKLNCCLGKVPVANSPESLSSANTQGRDASSSYGRTSHSSAVGAGKRNGCHAFEYPRSPYFYYSAFLFSRVTCDIRATFFFTFRLFSTPSTGSQMSCESIAFSSDSAM